VELVDGVPAALQKEVSMIGQRDERCAVWARREQVDPIGTALSYEAYLLLEWPRPWPSDLRDEPRLAPAIDALGPRGRVNALVPGDDRPDRRVIVYRRPATLGDWFVAFQRQVRVVEADHVVDAAVELICSPEADSGSGPGVTRDVIFCAHGSRDTCCGSRGTVLLNDLNNLAVDRATTRLWTSSHIGGHHFAPNAMLFPEGTVWGLLDADAARRIIHRQGDVDAVLAHYRGCAGLRSPELQAVERLAFAEVGWHWLDYRRRGTVHADGCVRLEAESPAGKRLSWEAVVRPGRRLEVPPCRPPTATTDATELLAADFTRST
jgi:hypothetical protein